MPADADFVFDGPAQATTTLALSQGPALAWIRRFSTTSRKGSVDADFGSFDLSTRIWQADG